MHKVGLGHACMNENHPEQFCSWELGLESMHQVVIFNDEVNTCEHVVACLMRIFGHPIELAVKIMAEAHVRGRAIAEVEVRTLAETHVLQLRNVGVQARVEKI